MKRFVLVLTFLAGSAFAQDRPSRIPSMAFIANSLGVTCTHCHVNKEWASDAKPMKEVARRHIAMTAAINKAHFAGEQIVTCNTCHQGQPRPAAIPLVANAGWNKTPEPATPLPSANEVIDRFLRVIGSDAFAPITARRSRGTVTRISGRDEPASAPFTLVQEPPSASVDTKLSYPPEANRELTRFFFAAPKLRAQYTSFAVVGRGDVRGRKVWIVEATPPEGRAERLSFDRETGLLLRRYRETPTPMGILPEEYDFDDWRAVGEVKLPFALAWSRADYHVRHVFEEIGP